MSRFLLVRLGALGDIVHAIPVAAALRRAFPSARIDWLVSAKHREILDLVPVIDRRLVVNDRVDRIAGERPEMGRRCSSAIRELRRARYDVAIDLQGLLKSAVLARASGRRAGRRLLVALSSRAAGAAVLHRRLRSGRRRHVRSARDAPRRAASISDC